jgi:hypothetical protein
VWGQNDSKDTRVRRGRGVGVVSDFRLPLEWVAAVVVDFDWELVLYNNRHRVSLSKHTFSFQSSPCVEDQSKRAAHQHQWKSIYTCCFVRRQFLQSVEQEIIFFSFFFTNIQQTFIFGVVVIVVVVVVVVWQTNKWNKNVLSVRFAF